MKLISKKKPCLAITPTPRAIMQSFQVKVSEVTLQAIQDFRNNCYAWSISVIIITTQELEFLIDFSGIRRLGIKVFSKFKNIFQLFFNNILDAAI